MNRSQPLQRHTPLARGTGLKRRSRLRPQSTYTGPTWQDRLIISVRCGGVCEYPGCTALATEPSHRDHRGMGGTGPKGPEWINKPANCLGSCRHHNDWVSNGQPVEAWRMGWRLKKGENPYETPVQMDGGVYLLDDDGGKHLVGDAA